MTDKKKSKPRLAAATQPTTGNRTGNWRFEKPVFVEQIAPCRAACPVGEDIPVIMALNDSGDFEEACHHIMLENPFPGICGKLCFHPCEKVCNRKHFDQAVSIRDLEYFVSQAARDFRFEIDQPRLDRKVKVAVAGGGPAGLSCAYFLAGLGYAVTILDSHPRLQIFTLLEANPAIFLTDLEREVESIISLGIDVRLNVGEAPDLAENFIAEYDVIYVPSGIGQWSRRLVKNLADEPHQKHVTLSTGAKRGRTLVLAGVRGSDTRLVYPDPFPDDGAGDSVKMDSDLSKSIVRDIAAGKFTAMVIDLSFRGAELESVRRFVSGRLGALSMASYHRNTSHRFPHRTDQVVRFSDLNTASFSKSNRIRPPKPDGLYTRKQAVDSARRCFKCGVCTFCRKCDDFCPDLSIVVDAEQKYREIDYDHCKGCGICAAECPRAAIAWVKE